MAPLANHWIMLRKLIILSLLIFTTSSCVVQFVPDRTAQPGQSKTAILAASATVTPSALPLIVTRDPNATATATPFQPLAVTLTPTPTPTLTPTPVPPTPTPKPPVPPLSSLPKEQVRILLLGSDARPGGGYRTDVMMLVTINPRQGTASVVSFPRDLYVLLPYLGYERLNSAMQFGWDTMVSTFQYNFGVVPQYYVMTNFDGFKEIIDTLDGVDVKVAEPLSDQCDLPIQDGRGYCNLKPGTMRMDGVTALWYVRSRHSTSDFDRLRRAQEVVQAIFNKLVKHKVYFRVGEYYKLFRNAAQTNLDLKTITRLAFAAPYLKADRISRYTLSPVEAIPTMLLGGAQVLIPNTAAIQAILKQATTP